MPEETTVSEEVTEVSEDQPEVESTEEASDGAEEAESGTESFTSVNPDELPDELKPIYKNLLSDYTRKTQEISDLKSKAQMYEQMQQQQLLEQKFPEPKQEAESSTVNLLASQLGVPVEGLDPEQRHNVEMLAKLIDATVEQRVTQQVQPLQQDLMKRDYQQELEQVKERYPDFNNYASQVSEYLRKNPAMTYEEAYKNAAFDDQRQAGRDEALKNREVKKAQANPKKSSAKTQSDPKGFEAIAKWAMSAVRQ